MLVRGRNARLVSAFSPRLDPHVLEDLFHDSGLAEKALEVSERIFAIKRVAEDVVSRSEAESDAEAETDARPIFARL